MAIQRSRKGRLQESKKRRKHGAGRKQPRRKIYIQTRRDGNMMGEESSQEGILQASKERWGYREAGKGDNRQARRNGNMMGKERSQK
jgi:hypothetical protein